MTAPAVSIRDLMTAPELFGGQFGGDSFAAWRALLCGFHGLPLTDTELDHWQEITGRNDAPSAPSDELFMIIGRRGGKSYASALLAIYEAYFRPFQDKLAPGERGTVAVMAADRRQARMVFRYINGLIDSNPMMRQMVTRRDSESIELSNHAVIEVTTASFRTARGATYAAIIADELAFWRLDEAGANPDVEVISAVRPGLATLGGPLIALSSPYSKRGVLWNAFRKHYGVEHDPVLVAQAPSKTMNPTLPQRVIDEAYDRDPDSAASEYGAEWRNHILQYIDREQIERLMRPEPLELPPMKGVRYVGFVDPSGGGKGPNADEFTLAIGHKDPRSGQIIVDLVRGIKGQSPKETIREYCVLLRHYGIKEVHGDRYSGHFAADEFAVHKIRYNFTESNRTGLYQFAVGVINSHGVELPPLDLLANQFSQLERRVSRSGQEIIDHAPGCHDDRANAAAGLIFTAGRVKDTPKINVSWVR